MAAAYARRFGYLFPALLSLLSVDSTAATPEIGKPAPELAISKYLRAPQHAPKTLSALRGNVVMLEFWTTWCSGCAAAIPHMNDLTRRLKDESFRLIVVANEPEPYVRAYLKESPLQTWVALDEDRRTTNAYAIRCYPLAFLLDKQGRIAAITKPANVTEATIRSLLAGRSIELPLPDVYRAAGRDDRPRQEASNDGGTGGGVQKFVLRPSNVEFGSVNHEPGAGRLNGKGLSPRMLIAAVHDISPWFEMEYQLPKTRERFEIAMEMPGADEDTLRKELGRRLRARFDFETRWQERTMPVILLKNVGSDKWPNRRPSTARESTGRANPVSFDLKGTRMKKVATLLSNMVFKQLVIEETQLEGRYDLKASWAHGDDESLTQALGECGLRFERTTLSRPVLVVTPVRRGQGAVENTRSASDERIPE